MKEHILVIRLGALGDLILCMQAFHEIRQAHPEAEIALLTMPAFAGFARKMPWFDQVLEDPRAPSTDLMAWLRLIKKIRAFRPKMVYDLQGKRRQRILYGLLGGPLGPKWSGNAPFCSHPRLEPPPADMHFTDFLAAQLQLADVPPQGPADLSWLDAPLDGIQLPERFIVLIPGCAPGRDYKRWPAEKYAELAQKLREKGYETVAIGTKADTEAINAIRAKAPEVIDLSARTTLFQLAAVLRRASGVISNDTGPAHLAAVLGVPTLVLMAEQVNATWSAPHGPRAAYLHGKPLPGVAVDKVLLALAGLLDRNE